MKITPIILFIVYIAVAVSVLVPSFIVFLVFVSVVLFVILLRCFVRFPQALLILIVLLCTTGYSDSEPLSPASQNMIIRQKYLFEISYVNHAWGHVMKGVCIDHFGHIVSYDCSLSQWTPVNPKEISLSELERKYSDSKQTVGVVDKDILYEMYGKIKAACEGELSKQVHIGMDAGITEFIGYEYHQETHHYVPVTLYRRGDWEQSNQSPEAKELTYWLRSVLAASRLQDSELVDRWQKNVPSLIAKMALWNSDTLLPSKEGLQSDPAWQADRQECIAWLKRFINPEWLPEKAEQQMRACQLVVEMGPMSHHETIWYTEWEKNGYHLRCCQGGRLFYLNVRPIHGQISEGDVHEQTMACQALVSRIVNNIPEVRGAFGKNEGINIAEGGTQSILLTSSFGDRAIIHECDNGIVGRASPVLENSDAGKGFSNIDLIRREHYWWRNMAWWTDGQTMGLYTGKINGL